MPRAPALICVLAVVGFASVTAQAGFTFNDFSDTSSLQLNGNAAQVGNRLRVTPATLNQSGSAFTDTATALGNLNSFSTHFRFQITASGGISDGDGIGADGIVFVIQTQNNNAGGSGGGIGYQGITPSIGIEFDTWNNGSFNNDPNGNHVGVDINGGFGNPTVAEPTRFNNDQIWNAWIDYDGITDILEARWSMSNTRPAVAQLATTVDLVAVLGQNTAFLGFTSGTGSAYGNHDILSWEYRDSFAPIGAEVPEPFAVIQWGLVIGAILVGYKLKVLKAQRVHVNSDPRHVS